jgi:hypothetical protein
MIQIFNRAAAGEKGSFIQDSVMEYEQAAFDNGEVHAPFPALYQERREFFKESWLGESPRRFHTNA